jgi:hypothetical protein
MYNDELDMILEDAYEDGYYQALADMDYEFDDEASEDVDIFDEDCFDDASEGAARDYRKKMNRGKSREEIQDERFGRMHHGDFDDPRFSTKYISGRHFRHWDPEIKEELIKRRDDKARRYDIIDGERIRDRSEAKYSDKAAKKVRDNYNARTRTQYDALKSKLQSSDLTTAQKRAAMEKFKARKLEEKRDANRHALSAKHDAWKRAHDLHWKQLSRRNGWDET